MLHQQPAGCEEFGFNVWLWRRLRSEAVSCMLLPARKSVGNSKLRVRCRAVKASSGLPVPVNSVEVPYDAAEPISQVYRARSRDSSVRLFGYLFDAGDCARPTGPIRVCVWRRG